MKNKQAVITMLVDYDCSMANVKDNFGNGMEGNFWDFHPGCHGITKFGEFKTYHQFADSIMAYHIKQGRPVSMVCKEYKYNK